MNLTFAPITRQQAIEYVAWRYEAPYDLYSIEESDRQAEIDCMLDRKNWTFAVICDDAFIAIRSFGDDGKVEGGSYDDSYQDTGGALRPDLTGRGYGEEILRAGLRFGVEKFGFSRFRVTVAAFNARALTVCQRVGFVEQQRFLRSSDEMEFAILTLETSESV